MHLNENAMRSAWESSIPPEFRPGHGPKYGHVENPNTRDLQRKAKREARLVKAIAYADECIPQNETDARIIELFRSGMTPSEIAPEVGRRYETIKNRLKACHPEKKGLR